MLVGVGAGLAKTAGTAGGMLGAVVPVGSAGVVMAAGVPEGAGVLAGVLVAACAVTDTWVPLAAR